MGLRSAPMFLSCCSVHMSGQTNRNPSGHASEATTRFCVGCVYGSGIQRPAVRPSIGRKPALYAIFGLSLIQYPRYR